MFNIEPVLWLLFCAAAFHGLGRFILLVWLSDEDSDLSMSLFLSSALGCGVFILLMFFLAVIQQINIAIIISILVISISLLSVYRQRGYLMIYYQQPQVLLLVGVILFSFLPAAMWVFSPETGADALSYHLPYAKQFAEHQGLMVNPYLRYPLNVLNFDLLYAVGFVLNGEILARLFHVYAAFLMLLGLYELGARAGSALAGALAAFVFIENDLVTNIMVSGYIDLGIAMFAIAALMPLLYRQQPLARQTIILSAIFLGLAIGTKYLGWLYLPILLLILLMQRTKVRLLLLYVFVCLLVAAPWYVRNIWISGNPLHPFLQNWFGYWLWTADDIARQHADLLVRHGIDRSFGNFIKLPWYMTAGIFSKHGNIHVFVAIGTVLAWFCLFSKKHRLLAIFVVANIVFWFFTSQISRYLLAVIPLLGLITALTLVMAVQAVWVKFNSLWKRNWMFRWPKKTMLILSILVIALGIRTNIRYFNKLDKYQYIAVNQQTWDNLLLKNPDYQLLHAANQNQAKGTLKFGFVYANYYAEHPIKGDWFGLVNMIEIVHSVNDDKDLVKKMKALNTDHVLVDFSFSFFKQFDDKLKDSPLFYIVAENPKGRLYGLKKPFSDSHQSQP